MPNKELVVVLPIHVFILSLFLGTSPKWINEEQKFSWKEIVRWSSRRALSWGDSLDTFRRRSSVSHYLKTSRPVSSEWIGNISIVLLLLTCSLGSVYVSDCCNLCKFFPRTCTIPASVDLFGLLGHICFVIYRCLFFFWLVSSIALFFF